MPLVGKDGRRAAAYVLPIAGSYSRGDLGQGYAALFVAQRGEQQPILLEVLRTIFISRQPWPGSRRLWRKVKVRLQLPMLSAFRFIRCERILRDASPRPVLRTSLHWVRWSTGCCRLLASDAFKKNAK